MKSEVNKKNIKDVTKELLLTKGYSSVNISEISKLTNIKRGAIYNYYKVKEDIYLDIVIDEFSDYIIQIKKGIDQTNNKDNFIELLVNNVIDRKELLILQSIMLPIIEPNATLESLVEFKTNISKSLEQLYTVFLNVYPEKSNEEIYENIVMLMSSITGIYPMTIATEKQVEAIKLSKVDYIGIDFAETLKKSLYKVLN